MRASEDQLLALLRRSPAAGANKGQSAYELSVELGVSEGIVRHKLKLLAREGKLGRGRRPGERIDGQPCWTPIYWAKDL